MDRLIALGTGKAHVTNCYNTCFILQQGEACFLVDGGGGNGILAVLEKAKIQWNQIHQLFVTHEHIDHLFGVIWVIRLIAYEMKENRYSGNLELFCNHEVADRILAISEMTLQAPLFEQIGKRILIDRLADGDKRQILNSELSFFDLKSPYTTQFGFSARFPDGQRLVCLGDESCHPDCETYVAGADWLLAEAHCLEQDKAHYQPHSLNHNTVRDACELAERMSVKNLLLWHTEDKNLAQRKTLYTREGQQYYRGRVFVPDDLEVIELH